MINKQKDTMIKTTNPFSGASIDLTEDEHELYTAIKTAERVADETMLTYNYDNIQKEIEHFSWPNTKAYQTIES